VGTGRAHSHRRNARTRCGRATAAAAFVTEAITRIEGHPPVCQAGPVAASPPPAADEPPEGARTPTSVRVAVVALWIMAGLLLANAALTMVALNGLVDRAVRTGTVSRAQAQQGILLSLIPLVLLGLILGLSAWGLGRRHAWARWTGLGAAVMLFALTLLTMLAAGGLLLASLLLLVLSMAACTSLLSRSTAEWVPRLRGGS
jgi:hypothetical protein